MWKNRRKFKVSLKTLSIFFFYFRQIFAFNPDSYDLALNNSIVVNLEVCHPETSYQEENFYCHASIQGQKDKEIIMNTHISATFVDPALALSKKTLFFRTDVTPNNAVIRSYKGKISHV